MRKSSNKAVQRFQIPEVARPYISRFLTREEECLVSDFPEERFTEEELSDWLLDQGFIGSAEEGKQWAARAFVRGILVKEETGYTLGDFYGRLDIYVTEEQEDYRQIPEQDRRELDAWYLDRYLERLKGAEDLAHPTEDRVLTLQETLDYIDEREDEPYLAVCDCRSLLGDCGLPKETCLTYRTGPNSFAAKGLARKISKEEARNVVKKADQAGLIHTANSGGICNCCHDCCYLFRAAQNLGIQDTWPLMDKQITLFEELCVGCGNCLRRCHFQVFWQEEKGGKVRMQQAGACVGCGLCATTCPSKALELVEIQRRKP